MKKKEGRKLKIIEVNKPTPEQAKRMIERISETMSEIYSSNKKEN